MALRRTTKQKLYRYSIYAVLLAIVPFILRAISGPLK